MHPAKVVRSKVRKLTDLPNVGTATAGDLRLLGIDEPRDLTGKCPYQLYETLCRLTAVRQDPCVIDVFMSVTRFMDGEPPQNWWAFTDERKKHLSGKNRP
jgi:hypothetical protein